MVAQAFDFSQESFMNFFWARNLKKVLLSFFEGKKVPFLEIQEFFFGVDFLIFLILGLKVAQVAL